MPPSWELPADRRPVSCELAHREPVHPELDMLKPKVLVFDRGLPMPLTWNRCTKLEIQHLPTKQQRIHDMKVLVGQLTFDMDST